MNERETLYIYYTVVASIIFLTLMLFVIRASNDNFYKQKSKVADLALETNSILSGNGNLIVKENVDGYYLEISKDCNLAVTSEKDQKLKAYYSCVGSKNIEINSNGELKNEISFEKTDNKLIVK
ncbi:hypothetical protein J4455_01030 [Candidatus Woesearchaeota archaeon]|nr:hypothetical protein [Candidatus Woesearchaeota archaeon]